MKKRHILTIMLALLMVAVPVVLSACSAPVNKIAVKIALDENDDGKADETLLSEDIELKGADQTVMSVLNELKTKDKVEVSFEIDEEGKSVVTSIADKVNKTEGSAPTKYFQWLVKVNGADVKGAWDEQAVKDGDTVTFTYVVWQSKD